ncbi:MAG: beta-galactosidase [Armatimonadota bacterium]|nr:beta-galactosidase [bacterium]
MKSELFPYGAQYYRTPNPPSTDWERDLREMKAQGMNSVRLWAMWSWIHLPNGEFDFSHLDRLMDLCSQVGLKTLIQVVLENAPPWLVHAHPHAKYTSMDDEQIWPMGRPNTPGGGWPGLCLDNPPASDAAAQFMTALASHFARHPALLGYDVWNEVWFELDGYIGPQYYCYCPATVAAFKEYLAGKYSGLDGLGDAWHRRYTSWDEVYPPRYWGGYPDWLDWIAFRIENQGKLLRWRVDTLRGADPDALLVSHGLPTTLGSMATHLTDDWRNAKEVDIYGLSCFPHWFNYQDIDTLEVHDLVRSASSGKTFWTAETQAGPSGEGLIHSRTPSPQDIRLWNWISLAAGAKGLLYWQWRPELLGPESPGFGLCHLDGTPTERTEAASWFPSFVGAHPEIGEHKPLKGQVAIAILPESQLFAHVAEKNAGKYSQAVRGAYRAFTRAGYQVDFARIEQLMGYEMVYLPFPLMIEEKSARMIAEYVQSGGKLISEACPAQFGNGGHVQVPTPGYGLDEVFGVRAESGPQSIQDDIPTFQWNGRNVGCCVHRQTLTAVTATVLAEFSDGGPAITENLYGSGRAMLVGTYPGICSEWGWQDAAPMLGDLAAYFGLSPLAHAGDPEVVVRLQVRDESVLAYVVNLSGDTREAHLRISNSIGDFSVAEDIDGGGGAPVDGNSFTATVQGRDARVFKLIPRYTRKDVVI